MKGNGHLGCDDDHLAQPAPPVPRLGDHVMTDARVAHIMALVERLASGGRPAGAGGPDVADELDAIRTGVTRLAQELEDGHAELDARVRLRTRDVERRNADIMQLTDLGTRLQACESRVEAADVVHRGVAAIFRSLSGAVHLFDLRDELALVGAWGDAPAPALAIAPGDCWALRRQRVHLVAGDGDDLRCRHAAGGTGATVCVPVAARGETFGLLHLSSAADEPGPIPAVQVQLAVAAGTQLALSLSNLDLRERLRRQALRDPLTGLYNRRFVDDWVVREVNRAQRSGTSLGVILADVDSFKAFNDAHGHDAGDRVLTEVADALRRTVRKGDVPCRYGGEEFLILVSEVAAGDLAERAEQVRRAVAGLRVEHRGAVLPPVTLSMGVALYPDHGDHPSAVITAADAAMYAAKQAGRDRVLPAPLPDPRG